MGEPTQDLLWKQYELHVGLYKHYLELALKFNVFYYAATGAILSYYFSKTDVPMIKYSLLFPVIMSLGFAILFIYGALALRITRQDVFDLRDKLGFETAPELNVLSILLFISASLMIGVAVIILWLFLRA
jgi:hypothetical protein